MTLLGKFKRREELIDAVDKYYKEGDTLTTIARKCDVSVRSVRRIIINKGWTREGRAIEIKPEEKEPIPQWEIKFVAEPCAREYCDDQGCPWHYAGVSDER